MIDVHAGGLRSGVLRCNSPQDNVYFHDETLLELRIALDTSFD